MAEVYGNPNFQTQLASNIPHDEHTLKTHMQQLPSPEKELICEVICLMKIVWVIPATNCTSIRSFRRLKTFKCVSGKI